jgi:hypothetical protein
MYNTCIVSRFLENTVDWNSHSPLTIKCDIDHFSPCKFSQFFQRNPKKRDTQRRTDFAINWSSSVKNIRVQTISRKKKEIFCTFSAFCIIVFFLKNNKNKKLKHSKWTFKSATYIYKKHLFVGLCNRKCSAEKKRHWPLCSELHNFSLLHIDFAPSIMYIDDYASRQ